MPSNDSMSIRNVRVSLRRKRSEELEEKQNTKEEDSVFVCVKRRRSQPTVTKPKDNITIDTRQIVKLVKKKQKSNIIDESSTKPLKNEKKCLYSIDGRKFKNCQNMKTVKGSEEIAGRLRKVQNITNLSSSKLIKRLIKKEMCWQDTKSMQLKTPAETFTWLGNKNRIFEGVDENSSNAYIAVGNSKINRMFETPNFEMTQIKREYKTKNGLMKIKLNPYKNVRKYEFEIKLIRKVYQHRLLYDPLHLQFCNKKLKEKTWQRIAQSLTLNVDIVRSKWFQLLYLYQNYVKKLDHFLKHSTRLPKERPIMLFANEMIFLYPIIKQREKYEVGDIRNTLYHKIASKIINLKTYERNTVEKQTPLQLNIVKKQPPLQLDIVKKQPLPQLNTDIYVGDYIDENNDNDDSNYDDNDDNDNNDNDNKYDYDHNGNNNNNDDASNDDDYDNNNDDDDDNDNDDDDNYNDADNDVDNIVVAVESKPIIINSIENQVTENWKTFLTSEMLDIINQVKNYPEIYDSRNRYFKDYKRRGIIWCAIANELGQKATKLMKIWIHIQTVYEFYLQQYAARNNENDEYNMDALKFFKFYILRNQNTVYKQSYFLRRGWCQPIENFRLIYNLIQCIRRNPNAGYIIENQLQSMGSLENYVVCWDKTKSLNKTNIKTEYFKFWADVARQRNSTSGSCEITWLILRNFYIELCYMRQSGYQLQDKWYFENALHAIYTKSIKPRFIGMPKLDEIFLQNSDDEDQETESTSNDDTKQNNITMYTVRSDKVKTSVVKKIQETPKQFAVKKTASKINNNLNVIPKNVKTVQVIETKQMPNKIEIIELPKTNDKEMSKKLQTL